MATLDIHRVTRAQVFVAGAGIMALEMVAGRLLAPRFGSTVYTWGALIGVVMAALAAGAYVGGRWADRWPRATTLSLLLFGGGAFALALPLLSPPVMAAVATVLPDARYGPIAAALIVVAPPAFALGAATPVAVRLTAGSLLETGSAAGAMSGISMAGSIVGTFATVFILMPWIGIYAILVGLGVLLGGASLATPGRRTPKAVALVAVLGVSMAGQAALAPELAELQAGLPGDVLEARSTLYHELYVTETHDDPHGIVRTLWLSGMRHSAIYLDEPNETPLGYVRYLHLGPLIKPDAERVLFIGGGAMTGPKQFLADHPDMEVTVVEVDPDVVDVAERFFFVPDSERLHVVVEDGRRFLEGDQTQWDAIVIDAFGRNWVPFHLLTVEFLELVRDRLAPEGVVVWNLIGSLQGPAARLAASEVATIQQVFPWVRHAPTATAVERKTVQELSVVAAVGTPQGWTDVSARAAAEAQRTGRDLADLPGSLGTHYLSDDDAIVFTDGFAPVESFLSPISRQSFTFS